MSLDRRNFLFAAGAAAIGGVALAATQEGEPDPLQCDPTDPNCPHCLTPGPDGCPVNLNRYSAAGAPAYTTFGVVLDLPPELRTKNWGGGSCVHASNVNLLIQMGQPEMAAWWRANYSGGENDSRLINRMEAAGLKYCWSNEPSFFDWCFRTRRGAGIFYKPSHSINFVGISSPTPEWTGQYKGREVMQLLDNNATNYPEQHGHYELVMREEFERRWRGYGAFAWSLVYDPPPGAPVL